MVNKQGTLGTWKGSNKSEQGVKNEVISRIKRQKNGEKCIKTEENC
jgi:hypothetical protein